MPEKPIKPNRKKIAALGLVLAPAAWAAWLSLGAGVALILRR